MYMYTKMRSAVIFHFICAAFARTTEETTIIEVTTTNEITTTIEIMISLFYLW